MARYVLITPAHNEEAFIEETLRAVAAQSVRPVRWVVVNDASTDGTREIVERHAREHAFIRLVNVERSSGRHFGNKVRAFKRGLEELSGLDYDYIGNLDADISFGADYVANILGELERDTSLGIAGGMVHTRIGDRFRSQEVAPDSVAGAVQMFRRACFEQVGGYMVLPYGGIDAAAEITARMHGWKTRTFAQYSVTEHRRTGSATDGLPLAARVTGGRRLYSLGFSFSFFLARCVYRALDPPWILGSAASLFGFVTCMLKGAPVMLPKETVRFLRAEQRRKLGRIVGIGR